MSEGKALIYFLLLVPPHVLVHMALAFITYYAQHAFFTTPLDIMGLPNKIN